MKKILIALLLAGLLAFGFFAARGAYLEMKRNRQIESEIATLENEAENLKKSNHNLRDRIAYFESQDFQELEAKRELNFQKPDESVVVVKPSPSEMAVKNDSVGVANFPQVSNSPNYMKWYNLFIK
jgi:cell division protein FtsB